MTTVCFLLYAFMVCLIGNTRLYTKHGHELAIVMERPRYAIIFMAIALVGELIMNRYR